MTPRAGDGKTFVVKQPFDFQHHVDVCGAIEPMTAGAFHRFQHREFGFPVAQDERF